MNPELAAFIMTFGFDPATLSPEQVLTFDATFKGKTPPKKTPTPQPAEELDDVINAGRVERERVKAITQRAQHEINATRGRNLEVIEAVARLAIDGGWDMDKFELEIFRQNAPQASSFLTRNNTFDPQVNATLLEVAVCKAGNLKSEILEAKYDEKTLDAADKKYKRGIGLNELVITIAKSNGYRGDSFKADPEAQRYAFGYGGGPQIHAAFSNISLPGILGNVQNKFLLEGWQGGNMTWSRISKRANHTDFKQHTSYRLNDYFEYDEVGPTGELHHGKAGETTYSNQLKTYGKLATVTRVDYYNDDLGVFTTFPKALAVAGIEALNRVFWTKFLNNSAFFTSGRANVSTGGGSALGLAGLAAAEAVFLKQTKPNGEPIDVVPEILLVPSELSNTGDVLMTSEFVVSGNTSGQGSKNTYAGKFRKETAPYMSNANYTGYSAAAWYLLSQILAVIEVAFLNGQEMPTIEQAEAAFNVLGFQMRAYHDFGVELQEYRGGVRSAGS